MQNRFVFVLRYLNRFSLASFIEDGNRTYYIVFTDSVRQWLDSVPAEIEYKAGYLKESFVIDHLSHLPPQTSKQNTYKKVG